MSREWKPGEVALVEDPAYGHRVMVHRLSFGNRCWHALDNDRCLDAGQAGDARPLVVIDPEDREQVVSLTDAMRSNGWTGINGEATDDMQTVLRSLIAHPKPEEPTGLGAVIDDRDGHMHVRAPRNDGRPWVGSDGKWRSFDQIDALSLVSEGVQ